MEGKMFDVVGLGACGVDYTARVKSFTDKGCKIISDNVTLDGGGVTANNLVQAARLGLKTAWCGSLGNDDVGNMLIKMFNNDKIEVFAEKFNKTQSAWIILDGFGEKQAYIFPNATRQLTPDIVEKKFRDKIIQARHFHTEVAVLPIAAAIKGAEIAERAKAKVLLDIDWDADYLINKAKLGTKKELDTLIELADVIKLSESAAKQIAGEKEITKAMKDFLKNTEIVVVTLAENGCYIADKNDIIKCPAYKVKCIDGTGAGDAFMGGLSYAILKGMNLKQIGMFANACGAYCCTKVGARALGNIDEINRLFKKND